MPQACSYAQLQRTAKQSFRVKDALVARRLTEIIFDRRDLALEASFWCAVLAYERVNSGDGWVAMRPPGPMLKDDALVASAQVPALAFVLVPEET